MVMLGIATSAAGTLWPPRPLPQGVKAPILAIELLRPSDRLDQIVKEDNAIALAEMKLQPRNERRTLQRAVMLDFAFIAAYTAFLVLFATLPTSTVHRMLGAIVIGGAITGAVFDSVENTRILALLRDASAPLPRGPSVVKWWALFVTAAAAVPLTIERNAPLLRRWIGYAAALFAAAAAAGGIYGLAHGSDQIVETAVGRLAIAWFLTYLFAASERTLRDGLHAALDRLATRPWLRRFATWPAVEKRPVADS